MNNYESKLTDVILNFDMYLISDHTYNRLNPKLNLFRVGINGKTYICFDANESTPNMNGFEKLTDEFGFSIKMGKKLFKPVIAKANN